MKVLAFVQTLERRRATAERLARALDKTDLDGYDLLFQRPGDDPWDHFFWNFETMAASDADLVIRLEDDAQPGKYLKHNVATWPQIQRPQFGAGWLYSSPSSIIDYIYHARLNNPNSKPHLDGSVAIVFRRTDLEWIIPACRDWARRFTRGYSYDYCISTVMREQKRELWIHDPPIVEHDQQALSAFAHDITPLCSTMGLFRPDYRR